MHQWWYNNIVFPYLNATFTHKNKCLQEVVHKKFSHTSSSFCCWS
jgi:hypothetical protein